MTVTISDEVLARFQAVAAPDEDFIAFLEATAKDALDRRERQTAGRAEMKAMLDGPRHRFDPEASYQAYREKYGWADVSHLSREELEDQGDALLDAMTPEKLAEAKRLGWV